MDYEQQARALVDSLGVEIMSEATWQSAIGRSTLARIAAFVAAVHAAGRAEGEREQDIYRAALAVVISDLGGEVTVSARALTEAPELADTEWATTDESFTEGQDVTFQIVVK